MNDHGVGPRYYMHTFKIGDDTAELLLGQIPWCCGAMQAVHLKTSDSLRMPCDAGFSRTYDAEVMKKRIAMYNLIYEFLRDGEFAAYDFWDITEFDSDDSRITSTYITERDMVVVQDAVGGECGVFIPSFYEMLHGREGVHESFPIHNRNSGNQIVTFTIASYHGEEAVADDCRSFDRIDWDEMVPRLQEDW